MCVHRVFKPQEREQVRVDNLQRDGIRLWTRAVVDAGGSGVGVSGMEQI